MECHLDLLAFRTGAPRLRPICRRLTCLLLLVMCGCSPLGTTNESGGTTHVFVWAWDVDKSADDFLAVVDVDRRSATYGQVVSTLPAQGGRGAHHVEYELSKGTLAPGAFHELLTPILIGGITLVSHSGEEPEIVVRPELDVAMYMDFVLDDGPSQDLEEARRLATDYSALLSQVSTADLLFSDLLQFARYADTTIQRLSDFVAGRLDEPAFARFISRRPWPPSLMHAVLSSSPRVLTRLATALVAHDWTEVRELLATPEGDRDS